MMAVELKQTHIQQLQQWIKPPTDPVVMSTIPTPDKMTNPTATITATIEINDQSTVEYTTQNVKSSSKRGLYYVTMAVCVCVCMYVISLFKKTSTFINEDALINVDVFFKQTDYIHAHTNIHCHSHVV